MFHVGVGPGVTKCRDCGIDFNRIRQFPQSRSMVAFRSAQRRIEQTFQQTEKPDLTSHYVELFDPCNIPRNNRPTAVAGAIFCK